MMFNYNVNTLSILNNRKLIFFILDSGACQNDVLRFEFDNFQLGAFIFFFYQFVHLCYS